MEDEINPIDPEEAEQAWIDDQADYGDYQQNVQEDQQFGTYQTDVPARDSVFTFFRHVLGLKDSSKVSNLDNKEMGMIDLSVRSCEYLAQLGLILHNKSYHDFFMAKSEITLATAMSKKGWLSELVVSQKKFSQRFVQPTATPQPKKGGFLGFGKPKSPI